MTLFQTPTTTVEKPAFTLRNYQAEAVDAAMAVDNGVVVLPTGSGKSLVIASIVTRSDGRTLVLQPTKEILESNLEKIRAFGMNDIGVYSASMRMKSVRRCTYATIGSIINKLHLFEGVETLIIDECHGVDPKGGQYEALIRRLKPKRLIGLTATPYRLHTTSMGSDMRMIHRTRPKLFSDIIYVSQTATLADRGWLMRPHYIVTGQEAKGLLQFNTTGAEYSDRSIAAYMDETSIEQRVLDAYREADEKGVKHVLVFMPEVRRSEAVVDLLRAEGIEASTVSGETPSEIRGRRLRAFRAGRIRVMVNVGVLCEGFDFPALDCIISARPTASLALYYQIIGRCVRPSSGKRQPVVFDLVDNFSKFGDPMSYRIVSSRPGLHAVLCDKGRLTNRIIEDGDERDAPVMFGQHRGRRLRDVPDDYIAWFLTNEAKGRNWHTMKFEQMRRAIFGRGVTR